MKLCRNKNMYFIIFILFIILFLQSCINVTVEETRINTSNTSIQEIPIKMNITGPDISRDCSLLTSQDIEEICHKEVKEVEAKLVKDAVCAKIFEYDKNEKLYFSYLDYGGTTPQQLKHCTQVLKGEQLTEHACFVAGNINTAYIFGSRYTLTLQNMNLISGYEMCSNLELMHLGKLISNRVYNNLTTSK